MMTQPKVSNCQPPIAKPHASIRDVEFATVLGFEAEVAPVGVDR